MEGSVNPPPDVRDCSEESGWTAYFEDFFFDEREPSGCSSGYGGSSLVSDAASCAPWKEGSQRKANLGLRNSFKKTKRGRGALEDEDLEDTASSPANSPKVSDFKHLEVNPGKDNAYATEISQVEAEPGNSSGLKTDERGELGFVQGASECTELKKKGLCLVPISMFANYIR